MRDHLYNPTAGDPRLSQAIELARDIYLRFEAGQDYSDALRRLSLLAGRPIHGFEIDSAFGSVNHETLGRRLLVDWKKIPDDLTHDEMLEMFDGIGGEFQADELQREFWLACLAKNTGDENVSDLIFWPGSYFGDGDDSREMTSREMLETALSSKAS